MLTGSLKVSEESSFEDPVKDVSSVAWLTWGCLLSISAEDSESWSAPFPSWDFSSAFSLTFEVNSFFLWSFLEELSTVSDGVLDGGRGDLEGAVFLADLACAVVSSELLFFGVFEQVDEDDWPEAWVELLDVPAVFLGFVAFAVKKLREIRELEITKR